MFQKDKTILMEVTINGYRTAFDPDINESNACG